jgi:hypothetical protein
MTADQDNPYTSPSDGGEPTKPNDVQRNALSPGRSALTGAIWAVAATFPIAAVTALVYRFPVPLVGYLSGIIAVIPALIAVLIYGILLGGFILLGLLGAIGGFVAGTIIRQDRRRCTWVTGAWALLVATAGVVTLAVLDKIIGPW